jgi:hypothetical protein
MYRLTVIFIAVTALVIAAYDVWVMQVAGKEASISWTLIESSYHYPVLTFSLGVICGHLFWRMKDPTQK